MKNTLLLFLCSLLCIPVSGQIPTAGLSAWFKADKGLDTSGPAVLSWKDQSRNNHTAFTKTPSAPILVPDGLHGNPVIRFNGKNNGMEAGPFQTFPDKRGTLIIVAKINGASATSGAGFNNFISTYYGNGNTWQFGATINNYSFYDGSDGNYISGKDIRPGEWSISTIVRDDDSTIRFYQNGRLTGSLSITDNQPDINKIKIGFNDSAEVMNGDIAEIILYGRSLTENELSTTHKYLSAKYHIGLTPPPFWETGWFFLLVMIFLLFAAVYITKYISQRKLRKQLFELEKLMELDKERLRISREMHDDIGAGLTQISLMSDSARKKIPQEGRQELMEIAATSRKIINSMNEIIWSLNPDNKTIGHLISYLRELINKQLEYTGIAYTLNLPDETPEISLNNERRRNILLVTKEIINNAIKHSNAKNISIHAGFREDQLCFTIRDDGKGFDANTPSRGNGLKNIRQRVEETGGKLRISSVENGGSGFEYNIPLSS